MAQASDRLSLSQFAISSWHGRRNLGRTEEGAARKCANLARSLFIPVRSRKVALRLEEGNGDVRDSVDRLGDTEHGRGHSGGQDVRCPCATKKVGESEMQGKPLHNK